MNRNFFLLTFIFFAVFSVSNAQNDAAQEVDLEFENIIEESNDFKDYKVVKRNRLNSLRNKVKKTSTFFQDTINDLRSQIDNQEKTIEQLNKEAQEINETLKATKAEVEAMSFLGVQTTKPLYNTFVWSVIGVLALVLVILILKFRSSNATTKSAKQQLSAVEIELEDLRRRSIEKEQKLGRQLQDERNKVARLKGE